MTDEGIRPPLLALAGLGAAPPPPASPRRAGTGPFMTVEDLGARTGVSKTVIEILEASGALKDIPRTAQLSFF